MSLSLQQNYGTCSNYGTDDMQPDLERAASRGPVSPESPEKDIVMRPLAGQASDSNSITSEHSHDSAQDGVKRLEAISKTWSKSGLVMAYLGIALLSFATSLESQTTNNLTVFATSAFSSHSLVATVGVVQGVVLSIAKPPMSKIADVFGRLEAFTLSVLLFILGYIQQAASDSVETYAAAQIFYAAGSTGLQILTQIFIADTSDLLNRQLISTLPDVPFLLNVWLGPELAQGLLTKANWRWGYGIWAVILPVAFLPLALALLITQWKAARKGLISKSQYEGLSLPEVIKTVWYELDVVGLLLLCGSFSLILIPLTLAANQGLKNNGTLAMLVIGVIFLCAFPFWERSPKLAPRAFFPRNLLKQRTVIAGLILAFFYFMAFYLSIYPYFQSYLFVVQGMTVSAAGHVVQTFTFTATITGIIVGILMKRTKRYKYFAVAGSFVYVLGLGLMIKFRTESSSMATIIASQAFVGIGGGMIHGPAQVGVQASASHQEVASATAVFLTVLEIGGAVGNAISGAIWSHQVPKKLALYLPVETKDQAAAIFGNVTLAATGWPLGSPTRTAISLAYQETMTRILTVAVVVAVPCIFLSLFLKNYNLDEIDQGVKGLVIGGTQDGAPRRGSEVVAGSSRRRWSTESAEVIDEDDDEDADNNVDHDSRRNEESALLFKRSQKRI